MTDKTNGNLPETIRYGGFLCEYAGTTTNTDAEGCVWYRHEYTYCDFPHKERVYFFRMEGDNEPIPAVTDFEIVRDVPRRDLPNIAEKKRRYNEYQRKYKRRKRAEELAKMLTEKIRGQLGPFGGE